MASASEPQRPRLTTANNTTEPGPYFASARPQPPSRKLATSTVESGCSDIAEYSRDGNRNFSDHRNRPAFLSANSGEIAGNFRGKTGQSDQSRHDPAKHRQRQDLQSKTLTQDVQERPQNKTAQRQKMNELPRDTAENALLEQAKSIKTRSSTVHTALLREAETVIVQGLMRN